MERSFDTPHPVRLYVENEAGHVTIVAGVNSPISRIERHTVPALGVCIPAFFNLQFHDSPP